ncbi:MAG: WbqC-like family protein [Bacteroidetes bacterium]|nr:MAG: WbqC-like family protein [Bacteroidota bacterium]
MTVFFQKKITISPEVCQPMPSQIPALLLPLACLPDIEFFCLLCHAPKVVFEIHETYPKQTCRNRYRIASANGPLTLSIPVIKPMGNHTTTNAVRIDFSENRLRNHWRAIESAYNKSPFFLYYRDDFEKIFLNPQELLIDFNQRILNLCLKALKLKPEFSLSDSFRKNPADMADLRNSIMPKHPENHASGILKFEPYTQVFSDRQEFIPNLSIIDLLFNLGPEAGDYLKRHVPEMNPA